MALLKQPDEIISGKLKVRGLIYGDPGLGKSTIGLSAPNPVMIDTDHGMKRVRAEDQVPSLQVGSYEEVLDVVLSGELKDYETIVIDTVGKLLDYMTPYIAKLDPKKNALKTGALTLAGYGARKWEFVRLMNEIERQGKHQIYIAHSREESDGDNRIIRPDIGGSSGADLAKEMDFIGFMESWDGKRTITFTPSDKFYAKNSIELENRMVVPDVRNHPNDFIEKEIIRALIERLGKQENMRKQYNDVVDAIKTRAADVTTAEKANDFRQWYESEAIQHVWSSKILAKNILLEKMKEHGFSYDKDSGVFV